MILLEFKVHIEKNIRVPYLYFFAFIFQRLFFTKVSLYKFKYQSSKYFHECTVKKNATVIFAVTAIFTIFSQKTFSVIYFLDNLLVLETLKNLYSYYFFLILTKSRNIKTSINPSLKTQRILSSLVWCYYLCLKSIRTWVQLDVRKHTFVMLSVIDKHKRKMLL